jgi:hypothetical protein
MPFQSFWGRRVLGGLTNFIHFANLVAILATAVRRLSPQVKTIGFDQAIVILPQGPIRQCVSAKPKNVFQADTRTAAWINCFLERTLADPSIPFTLTKFELSFELV